MASPQPQHSKLLRVGIIQGDRILEERHVLREDITIGHDGKNTLILPPHDDLPAKFALFENRNNQYQLVFDDTMQGRIHQGASDVDLTRLRKQGLAQERGPVYVLPLEDTARGKVEVGDVTLFFQFIPPTETEKPQLPPGVKGSVWKTMDRVFFAILASSLLLHLAWGLFIVSSAPPLEAELSLDELEDRFVRAEIIPQKLLREEPVAEKPQPSSEDKAEKPTEKKDPEEAKPAAPRPSNQAEQRAELVKKVSSKGLLKILGASGSGSGGGAFADILGSGTGGNEIAEALAGAGGVGVATTESVAAGGPRGGGTGSVASIGEVGTRGGGNVDLGTKKEVTVVGRVKEATPEVDSGDVDREALSRYIKARLKAIQGCYEKELKRNPSLKGKVVVRFTIKPSGRTSDIDIEENTLGNEAVGSCIRTVIRSWVFPFKPDDEVSVAYPFLLSPTG
ncbi:AgmX/PglI C-terminal domain-containing protein [Stigmatella sp. ncwal1]|uniref:AgmX/PglI C-terminal domain-containing protein n=1 Tax=Stigmatella ashevillensis TaxID=2995309 RepID=A0ABT5DL27_9BACT|nr:AgmX/PglI C-terminal domain-containing protein [Stigmatella ashevillena]MDC0714304.1 AgmX/PglI C-terminal domain-containing protein [Stigmatella ashevillena]